jgi:phage terminase large subunit
MEIKLNTPRWALPLLRPCRYKGIKGGRGSGKSHFVAETRIEELLINPDSRGVCIREFQKSLKFSSKQLLEDKIKLMQAGHLFDITLTEIKRKGHNGLIIFQGMQDHTADSIKSLEGFDWAWVEEAQNMSHRSLQLLRPTIRKEGSELIFTWNPNKANDAVDYFFNHECEPQQKVLVHVNWMDNPFLPSTLREEAEAAKRLDYEVYHHVWEGGYNTKSEAKVFGKRWRVEKFTVDHTFGYPMQGLDFGFSQDPLAAVRIYIKETTLYVAAECGDKGIELDDTIPFIRRTMPDFEKYPCYADSSRPESISYLKRHGLPRIKPCDKWSGSVEDGLSVMKSFTEIVIHDSCVHTINEFNEYSYKIDKMTGEVTDTIVDSFNHFIDAIRYALNQVITRGRPRDYKSLI